jgi:hypothetical protein
VRRRPAAAVFTTTNSQALERLIEDRGLFDWAVMTEAGTAVVGRNLLSYLASAGVSRWRTC